MVSPCESDAQIAYLVTKGWADFAITEDSDLLVSMVANRYMVHLTAILNL